MNKITNLMVSNRQKKKRLFVRTLVMTLFMALFTQIAQAQQNVYMHTGSSTITGTDKVNFYDSGGKSSGPEYYWERWFLRNEDYTYTFKAEGNNKIKVTFKPFTAYTDNNGHSTAHSFTTHEQWALRLNTAELYIYDGMTTDAEKLIGVYTGSVINEFSVMADGPMTFRFKSYGYREEGWEAVVEQVAAYSLQKPSISFQVCDDQVVINANNPGVKLYYTTDGSDPTVPSKDLLSAGTLYDGPFSVAVGTEIRAIAYDSELSQDNNTSEVTSLIYNDVDVTPTPGKPTITRTGNTITIEPAPLIGDINETYEAWYKTTENGVYVKYTEPIQWNTPNTTFYAITKPVSCSDKISVVETLLFDKVQVPDPTITFTDVDENTGVGTVTISCEEGYVISYTVNGIDPTTTDGEEGPITIANVAPGTTVKAIAYKVKDDGTFDDNYKKSNIVTLLCLPGGEGEGGVYGGVVLLDDREDHSWTYYSDSNSPIKSLKPADVKITYSGYGPNTMTSTSTANMPANSDFNTDVTANQVAVNVNEPGNQFIYLKTLENANEDGSGNYPYTMIANPFQVRPTYEGEAPSGPTIDVTIGSGNNTSQYLPTYTYNRYSFSEQIYTASEIGSAGTIRTLSFRVSSNATSRNVAIYLKHTTKTSFTSNTNWESMSSSDLVFNGTVTFTSGWTEITLDTPFEYNGTSNLIVAVDDNTNGWQSSAMQCYTYNAGSNRSIYVTSDGTNYTPSTTTYTGTRGSYCNQIKFSSNAGSSSSAKYRGFYAWRVKSLGGGISIDGKDVGDIIYPDETIEFVTSNAKGNEVEFEALWAKAWVNASSTSERATNDGNYKNAYERNFKTGWASYTYPVTYSSRYPDGTVATSSSFSVGSLDAGGDIKFENMTLTADRLNGNNHSLHIGRGVGNGTNNVTSAVYGYQNPSGNINGSTLRIESGRYTNAYLFYGSQASVTSTATWNMILGSDYDRANTTNSNLIIAGAVEASYQVSCTQAASKINVIALSGTFGTTATNTELYMGYDNRSSSYNTATPRYLEVLGGSFLGGISGGIDYGVADATEVLKMRIRGGNISQYLYGSGQYAESHGSRKTIITGGAFNCWIAGGCYGTDQNDGGGQTYGNTYLYFGGKANQTNTAGVFGGGYGSNGTGEGKYTVVKSFVVAADEAQTAGNVYGGGNNGYCTDDAVVYVKGTTLNIAGSVYGGANMSRSGGANTITVKDGTIGGSVYGGAQGSSATTNIVYVTGKATVNVEGGTMTNVYGGGLGAQTRMNGGTEVNVKGGTINNNVYGGGALGTVSSGNTLVNVSGGTMKDVFGAGQGGTTTAQITGQTYVNVTGGTIANVYGGGEAGDVYAGITDPTINTESVTIDFEDNSYSEYLTSSGNYAWERSTTSPQGGSYCFRSTNYHAANTNSSFTMTYNFEVAQTISFYYKVSSQSNNDYLNFYVDGNRVQRWSGTVAWAQYTYNLTAGNHTLEWRYSKNRNTDTGDDRAWVDNITFTKVTSVIPGEPMPASFVTIAGATVSGDVFGGGKLGKTTGNTQVDIESGNVRGNVFGGAYGSPNQVFVAGMHTVNMMGGRIFGNLYGGSRNANDALAFTGYNTTETKTSSVVNISAGQVDQQVYAAGYYGKTFGSVYVMIGTNAIINAPHAAPSFGEDNETEYKAGNLRLNHNVWAGGDWGEFQGGSFGAATVSGYSDIYVDGDGYNTETSTENAPTYMNIAGSIFCCGTSCDAGTQGRAIYVSNYGHAVSSGSKNDNFPEPFTEATRTFYSLQRADTLIINNSHINFIGQAKIYSLDATEKYAFVSFDKTVRIVNGSSLFLNAIASQIKDFWSATCGDVYASDASYSPVGYDGLGAAGSDTDNKIRVNGGNFIEVYHDKMINNTTGGYGMLNGFAHMMVAESTSDNTCAYARPKQCQDTPINSNLDNSSDGGFVSYDAEKNTFDINGNSHDDEETGATVGDLVQMPYENHVNQTRNGEQYFRIWRAGGVYSTRQAVVNILADGQNTFDYVDVSVKLPAWRDADSYFKFQTTGTPPSLNTTIAYGSDVMMYNSAIVSTSGTTQNWVHFDEQNQTQTTGSLETALEAMRDNPNVNFGLVTMAGTAMSGDPLIVSNESDAFLAKVSGTAPNYETVNKFTCGDFEKNPEVTFRFTYSNLISTNMTWDPMYITLVQVDKNGKETDIVKIAVTINVATTIDREFVTQTYAVMNSTGSPNDEYVAKVVLPTFEIYDPLAEHLSQFKLQSVTFAPETGNDATAGSWISRGGGYDVNHFAMEISAANNEDNTDGWNGTSTGFHDSKTNANANGLLLGENGGREPFAFDFRLTYKGDITYTDDKPRLGVLTFNLTYDNVKVQTGTDPNTGEPTYGSTTKNLVIKVHVIRRGKGAAFYLDGQHGSNANDARYPDKAVLALSTIYNRCGYLPGDIIYVVNTVDVSDELEWSGTKYNGVTIYRYPGGHALSQTQAKDEDGHLLYWTDENHEEQTTTETDYPVMIPGVIVGNPDNIAHKGNLVNVKQKGKMEIRDIILDGHKSSHPRPVASGSKVDDAGVESTSPLITVASGGTLTLSNGAMLQENNTTANGGAVAVNDGGMLMMNKDAIIANNVTTGDGGGVYMAGTMIVSDNIQIWENKKEEEDNNVVLTAANKVIQIGTTVEDEFGPLVKQEIQKVNGQGQPLYWTNANHTESTTTTTEYPVMVMTPKIGVTKDLYGDVDGYTQVVYVEDRNDIAWLEVPFNDSPNSVIFHDGELYQLEKYNDPQYLYWIGTWVTVQYWNPNYESDEVDDYDANDFDPSKISTAQELAWLISYVNGLNGADVHEDANAVILKDIDMSASIWVPIGNAGTPFEGTFEGNGHVITGVHSILVNDNAGMFGVTEGATIQNVVAKVVFDGNSVNKGSFIGTMIGGTLSNVEAAGDLVGKDNTLNMGGLVGLASTSDDITTKPVIHSSFAVNNMTAEKATTVMGGLVGSMGGVKEVVDEETQQTTVTNYTADLYNSYANVTLGTGNAATTMGGLVGVNNQGCTVENCYVINPMGPAFAYTNKGTIKFCYAAKGTESFVSATEGNVAPTGHGTYDVVMDRKELGYLYGDNKVTAQTADTTYIRSKIFYDGGKIATWPGLVSTLNQWVDAKSTTSLTYTPWFRPITQDLNGDLPVLAFPKDNCLGNQPTADGKMLRYSACDEIENDVQTNNGLDNLLVAYKDQTANIFLYGNAINVENVPTANVNVTVNEDAVLMQKQQNNGTKANEANFINTTVGVTFDNSCKAASDYFGTPLEYDWHLMSTPLADAPMGTTYGSQAAHGAPANILTMEGNYMPNGLLGQTAVTWDLYTYYEPEYHWINFKRGSDSHWHYDEPHDQILYTNETIFTPGHGYMMAISQDSYLNQTGTLNNGVVEITLTLSGDQSSDTEPTKDWGSNLIGNPYQAYLDLEVVSDKTGLESFYVYDADNGTYGPYTTDASVNTVIPSRFIHPHQAFFAVIDEAYAASYPANSGNDGGKEDEYEQKTAKTAFTYEMATATKNGVSHFRGETQPMFPLVNLFVENEAGSRDLAIVELNRPELGGVRKIDNLRNANFKLYAHYDGGNYGLLFTPEDAERVPVHFRTMEDGTFTLTWQTMHGTFTNLILVDNLTGTRTNMLTTDHYTFEGSVDDYAARFYITFNVTGVDELNGEDGGFAWFDGNDWIVTGKGQLDVIDVTGRVLRTERVSGEQTRLHLDGVAAGVYMMRLSEGNRAMTQKIVVK
jgi:hypothetical protein